MTVETYLLFVAPIVLLAGVSAMMLLIEFVDRRRDKRVPARSRRSSITR